MLSLGHWVAQYPCILRRNPAMREGVKGYGKTIMQKACCVT